MHKASQIDFHNLDDRQLMGRFYREQNEQAFSVLVERHGPMVFRVCLKILGNQQDAEDAYQAVFIVLAQKAGKVRWQKCLAKWLYGVSLRLSLKASSRMQKQSQQIELNQEIESQLSESEDQTAEISVEAERTLYEEIDHLPGHLQEPLLLCSLEGQSRQQAAELLGIKLTTLIGRLERARELLRTRLLKREIVLPVTLLGGVLAHQTAEAGFSQSLIFSPQEVATQLTLKVSFQGNMGTTAIKLAQGEFAKMLMITQVKFAAVSVCVLLAIGVGSCLVIPKITSQTTDPKTIVAETEVPPVLSEAEFRKQIPGEWNVSTVFDQGVNNMPGGYSLRLHFTENKMVMMIKEPDGKINEQPIDYTLDYSHTPIWGDFTMTMSNPMTQETMQRSFPGIIEIRGGILKVCMNKFSEVRPPSFAKSDDYGLFVANKNILDSEK